jgi:hypothetical protein
MRRRGISSVVIARLSANGQEGVDDPDVGGGDDGTGGGGAMTTTTAGVAATAMGPRVVVNSVTLRFNNMLNRMAKNLDSVTVPRVQTLLLKAVKEYELHEDRLKSKDVVVDGKDDDP